MSTSGRLLASIKGGRSSSQEQGSSGGLASALGAEGKVRKADVQAIANHLAALLNAGLPLVRCLKTLAKQFKGKAMAAVVRRLVERVGSGDMLSSAMGSMPDVFDRLTVDVVRAGEVGAALPETLKGLADDMERKNELRKTIINAVTYPLIVIGIAILVVGFVVIYVVPTFEDVYDKMSVELPWMTKVLLFVSHVAVSWWWLALLGLGAAVMAWRPLMNIESVRYWWDSFVLRVPVVGSLRNHALAARLLSVLGRLTGNGVGAVESLQRLEGLADNVIIRDAIDDIHRHVSHGGRIAERMEQYSELFPPMAVQMLSVGEETGNLADSAVESAKLLARDVENRVNALTALLQPLLTIMLGVIVGMIALAIYLPMFDLMSDVAK